ncbi:hypothetical protein LSCM1_04743 [Leishmania martiniquensis]|uniref:Gamma-butyrobetaine hydroxylase-like N-terminal domain-containing protein n=1 Tax=Leishmania martiniquensis TaxID=1580590 RepID=A0A836KKZ4_9TRYP|nr:hypothetical protein LSCM1_04743 [Leishmania martiniquensis]
MSTSCLRCLRAACASATARRFLTASFVSKLGDSVASKVSQLTEKVWLADGKLVTERRRKLVPQRASNISLAERLAAQRNVRQRLVPTSVKIDKSRQYVEFTWPEEAVEAMRTLALDAGVRDESEPPDALSGQASSAAARSSWAESTASSQAAETFIASIDLARHGERMSAPSPAPQSRCSPSDIPLRTRALAEYLRAYTPSTDGTFSGSDIVIYGRRGITVTKVIPIGNYALRFVFSDDHSGGIYSYEYLYHLTGPPKYRLMRNYIAELRRRRKPRDPPKRAPSAKHAKAITGSAVSTPPQ